MLAWVAAQTERIDVGSADLPDPGPHAGDDRDDRRDPRHAVRRPVPARPRRLRPAGLRGLARRAVRQAAGPHPRVRRHRPDGAAPARRSRYEGEHYTLPLPDGPGKALQADRAPGARAHPDLPRRGRPEEPRARPARSPTAGWRSSSPRSTPSESARRTSQAGRATAGPDAGRLRRRADRAGRRRRRPRRRAPTRCARYAALYVGGMGSREQNFYNQLAVRMGYERGGRARSRTCTSPASTATRPPRCRSSSSTGPSLIGPRERIRDRLAGLRRGRGDHAVGRAVRRRPGRAGRGTAHDGRGARRVRAGGVSRVTDIAILRGDRPRHRRGAHRVPAGLQHRPPDHRREGCSACRSTTRASPRSPPSSRSARSSPSLIYFCARHRADRRRLGPRPVHAPRSAATFDYRFAWFVIVGSACRSASSASWPGTSSSGPLRNLWVVAVALIVWSAVMVLAERAATQDRGEEQPITLTRRAGHRARPVHRPGPRRLPVRRHDHRRPAARPGPGRRHPAVVLPRHPGAGRRRALRAQGRRQGVGAGRRRWSSAPSCRFVVAYAVDRLAAAVRRRPPDHAVRALPGGARACCWSCCWPPASSPRPEPSCRRFRTTRRPSRSTTSPRCSGSTFVSAR